MPYQVTSVRVVKVKRHVDVTLSLKAVLLILYCPWRITVY